MLSAVEAHVKAYTPNALSILETYGALQKAVRRNFALYFAFVIFDL